MTSPAPESLPSGELTDAELEGVVAGKALRRDRGSQSRKPPRDGDNSPAPKLDRAFERQNQNSNSNSN